MARVHCHAPGTDLTAHARAQRFRAWFRERVREVFRDVDVLARLHSLTRDVRSSGL
jgi:hypothetical protein